MRDLLSVIIPVHNVERYLDTCIKSIVNQTYKNLEIILVDDGSVDSSFSICQKWQTADERIICYHFEIAGGAVRARQKGIEMSTADYIAYVDSDDWLEADAFDKLMKAMMDNDADLVMSTGFYCDFAGGQTKPKDNIRPGVYSGKDIEEICEKMVRIEAYPTLVNRVYKKSKHLPYQQKTDVRIKINNDITCILMTVFHMEKIVVIDEYLYHYVTNNNSIVHTYRTEYLESNCLMYKLVKEEMINTGREYLLQDWKENFLDKLFMNIRLECSRENKINSFDKMKHLRELYDNPVLKDFIREKNVFNFSGRERVIWFLVQKRSRWFLYFYLKANALKMLLFKQS